MKQYSQLVIKTRQVNYLLKYRLPSVLIRFLITTAGKYSRGIILLCLLLSFSPSFVIAQYTAYKQVNSLNSKLSSERIRILLQDKKGYLWIGTDDGLNRYDGYSFTVYKNIPDDSTTIPDNDVRSLAIDSAGNVWAGFSNGYLSYYNYSTHSFTHFNGPQMGLAEDIISKIFFDSTGRMWIGVIRNGLYYFDEKAKRFIKAGDLPGILKEYQVSPSIYKSYNSIYDIHEDSLGVFWMATHDGLYLYHPKTNEFEVVRQKKITPFEWRSDLFNDILPAKDGYWFSAWGGGLTFYNPKTREWKNYKMIKGGSPGTHNIIEGLEWKENDQIWVASTDYGFGYFDIKKEAFTFLDTNRCQEILKDRRGVLWVASEIDGLMQFDPTTLFAFKKTNVTRTDNGEYYFTNGFYHDLDNHVLYYGVSFGDGLHAFNEITEKETAYSFDVLPSSEKALQISHIYKDNRDTLWVLTSDYIYWFDRKHNALKKFQQPFDDLPSLEKVITPDFYRMVRATNGDLWITSLDKGVFRYSFQSKKFTNYTDEGPNNILSSSVRAIEEDAYGRVWMLTSKGISLFNYKDNSFHDLKGMIKDLNLNKVKFSDLTRSSDGDIWISSNNGIYMYDHRSDSIRLTHWSIKEGVPSGKIKSVKVDSHGSVWFLTSTSLWRLYPKEKKITYSIVTPTHFSSSSFYIDGNNEIYLGSYGGYNTFKSETQFIATTAPPLVISSFKVNNKEIFTDSLKEKKVNLKYNQNSITIEFTALDFRNSSKNKYSFKLEGIDSDWTYNTDQRLANYVHLAPGNYTFKVKAATPEGIWTEPLEIEIHISHPFWSTWYFLACIVLATIYLIYLLSRWRTTTIRKEEIIKSAFEKKILETEMSSLRAQMNPHFIFNSLNSINKFILMADPETASFYLTKFSKLIRLILENSNKARISLDQELTALKHYIDMELLRFDHNFSYHIQIDPGIDPLYIQFPPLIIQPYVENAIWHGFIRRDTYGILSITISKEKQDLLLITIEDNGVGRNYKKNTLETFNKKSHGLKITEDRLNILSKEGNESSVEIIDLKNERNEPTGTKVIIRLSIMATPK